MIATFELYALSRFLIEAHVVASALHAASMAGIMLGMYVRAAQG